MSERVFVILCFFIAMTVQGCVPLNHEEVLDLKGQVAQLQIECSELRSDLTKKISVVESQSLETLVRDLQDKMSLSSQKIPVAVRDSDRCDVIDSIEQISVSIYQMACGDYSMGRYELAYSGFQSFLEKSPRSKLAPQAQFYLGECFYSQKMWANAIDEYEKVEQNYPESNLVCSARFKIALCYENVEDKQAASELFSSVVENFPESSESVRAMEKLKAYTDAKNT